MTLEMTLFVNGASTAGQRAQANIRAICDASRPGAYVLEVVDVLADPDAAEDARIIATPTLIRSRPLPQRRIIGDFSDTPTVQEALGLAEPKPVPPGA